MAGTTPHPATTVLMLRSVGSGFQVFMVQRNRSVGFMPSAWVFPGGRVDAGDRLLGHTAVRGGTAAAARMGLEGSDAIAHLVAGVREAFEESGLWLGEGTVPQEYRPLLANRQIDMSALLSRFSTSLDLDRLRPWSWWITPELEPKRFDTRFIVAIAPEGVAEHDAGETVASEWIAPAEAVSRAERGELPMAPPTWWTLRELAEFGSVDEVMEAVDRRSRRPIQPIIAISSDGTFELHLPGHPDHPEPEVPGLPSLVCLVNGRWESGGLTFPRAAVT